MEEKLNLNTATRAELMALGISEFKARRIISYRDSNRAIGSVESLRKVRGIGEKTYELLRDKVYAGPKTMPEWLWKEIHDKKKELWG